MTGSLTPSVGLTKNNTTLPSLVPGNKKELQQLIETNSKGVSSLILRDNGYTPDNGNLLELMEVVGQKHAAMALVPIVVNNPIALIEIFEAADEYEATELAKLAKEFAKQNSSVALWKWFLTERGKSYTASVELGDDVVQMSDLGDISETISRGSNKILTGEDRNIMDHLLEVAPSLARAISQSMKRGPSSSVNAWVVSKTPKKPSDQLKVTSRSVGQTLNNAGPKPSDYV